MVRMYRTARKNAVWHPPIPIIPIPDSPPTSDAESDPVPLAVDSSDESIDYLPVGPEIEILEDNESDGVDYISAGSEIEAPEPEASEEDDVQIIEPPLIPVVDLVTEEENESEEEDVQILEPPPIPVLDLVSEEEMDIEEVEENLEDEDEEELEPMDTSEDTISEQEELVEFDEFIRSFEECRHMASDSSLWDVYWRVIPETIDRTRIKSSPNLERIDIEVDDSGCENDKETSSSKRVRSFGRSP
jgi:hypothetical protein